MPELIIKHPEDIKKLAGWTIVEAGTLPPPGGVGLKLSHPAASCQVVILFKPGVVMGLSGNVVTATSTLGVESRDVDEEPKEA